MSRKADHAVDGDSLRNGIGSLALTMMALWLGPAVGPDDLGEMPRRIGPGVLLLWTLVGIGLGAVFSIFRTAFGGGNNAIGFAVAAPMFLPLLLGTVRLPERRVPALALALVLGGAVGVVGGLTLPAVLGTYWAIFISLSAGALVASASYGMVARQGAPANSDSSPTE